MRRKLVALIMVVLLVTSMATLASASEKTKITWMCWGNTGTQDNRNAALLTAFPDLAQKYELVGIIAGSNAGDVAQQLRLMMAAGGSDLPDIFHMPSMYLPEFAEAGIIEDLSSAYEQYNAQSLLMDGVYDMCTYRDKQVAFPYCLNTLVWYYRSDIFKQADIDIASLNDVDAIIEAGKKMQAWNPDWYITEKSPGLFTDIYNWLLNGANTRYWDAEAGSYKITGNQTVVKLLTDLKKLYSSDVCCEINQWTPDWEQGLAKGIASTLSCNWLSGSSFLPTWCADSPQCWGARSYPFIGGINSGSENGGATIFVNKNSKNKEVAIDILSKICFTEEGNWAMYNPAKDTQSVVLKSVFNDPSITGNAFYLPSYHETEGLSYSNFKVQAFTPCAPLELSIASPYVQSFLRDEITLEVALSGMENDMNSQIGDPYSYY